MKGEKVAAKIFVFLALVLFVFCLVLTAQAQTVASVWRDDINYSNFNEMSTAGWTAVNSPGISFGSSSVILDGTQTDTSIRYSNKFPSGIYDWKVETRTRWILGSHSGNAVSLSTDKHSYAFLVDGWYSEFAFYRDDQKILRFGSYQEESSKWLTLRLEKHGNQISMYLNDQLENTYTETDSSASQLVDVYSVSPWIGGAEYDYFQVWSIGSSSTPQPSVPYTSSSNISALESNPWVPQLTNAVIAPAAAVVATAVASIAVAAAIAPVGAPTDKITKEASDLMPSTIKQWLSSFVSSKRKLKVEEKTGSIFKPTKGETIVYILAISLLTFSFSYVKVPNLSDILVVLPTILGTSIFVGFVKTFASIAYSRHKGVWTEYRLWYFGLATFIITTFAFRVPFSSPTRSVHFSPRLTEKLSAILSMASVLMDLAFAGFFLAIFLGGFKLIGSTGLAMCIIGAFFDTFPIAPMNGKSIFNHNKALWTALFFVTLSIYIAWLFLM